MHSTLFDLGTLVTVKVPILEIVCHYRYVKDLVSSNLISSCLVSLPDDLLMIST